MSEEDRGILTDEMVAEKKDTIERINRQIEDLQWEVAGEPETEDADYVEEMYYNSPEKHLDDLFTEREQLEEELFKDEYYRNLKTVIKNSEYETYRIGKLLADDYADVDMFNRKVKAIQVAEDICGNSEKYLFNIGIIGEWGTGKSTLLNMIKKELNKQKDIIEVSYIA